MIKLRLLLNSSLTQVVCISVSISYEKEEKFKSLLCYVPVKFEIEMSKKVLCLKTKTFILSVIDTHIDINNK